MTVTEHTLALQLGMSFDVMGSTPTTEVAAVDTNANTEVEDEELEEELEEEEEQ